MQRSGLILFVLWCLALPVTAETILSPTDGAARDKSIHNQDTSNQVREYPRDRGSKRKGERSTEGAKATNEYTPATTISYDKETDHLSVVAAGSSLKSVLGRIAQQSGIEVLFDDKADEAINIDIQANTLEQGLQSILKGRNSVLRYSKDAQDKVLLVGVTVLPVGESTSGNARRLMNTEEEAYQRARQELSSEQVDKINKASERWQTRLSEMSPEHRAALERRVNKRLLQQAKLRQHLEEKRKRGEQIAQEMKAKRQAEREANLEMMDPETRADVERRGALAREQIRVELLENQN